jgi:diguanylate cyclase (GGDEF)-like protein
MGADAYFIKPFDPETLSVAVAAKLQQAIDIKRQSGHDLLTGLPNRAAYTRAFRRASMLALRSREPLTVAILDLDLFKTVNDTFGHAMGDEVLRRLSQVIVNTLRTSDLLARWGGEEFAVFFPNTDVASAKMALGNALKAVRAEKFVSKEGHVFSLSFSAGLSCAKAGYTTEQVIAEADRILYLAKQSGRNQILSPLDKVTAMKRTILIVEDNRGMAAAMKHHLRGQGFRIVQAADGDRALQFVRDHAVSLITVDVNLPGIDGFELLRRLRDVPTLGHIPIIMVTAAAEKKDILKGFQQGANDYIVKPFAPAELRARVHRFLKPRVGEKPQH